MSHHNNLFNSFVYHGDRQSTGICQIIVSRVFQLAFIVYSHLNYRICVKLTDLKNRIFPRIFMGFL